MKLFAIARAGQRYLVIEDPADHRVGRILNAEERALSWPNYVDSILAMSGISWQVVTPPEELPASLTDGLDIAPSPPGWEERLQERLPYLTKH